MARLILLSDLHLSPTHGFFWDNFVRARNAVNAAAPDLVIVAGDLCIDGPDSDAEMAFAGRALATLVPPWLALPGNHDVGDEPPGQDPRQLVDAARLVRWNGVFGADRFARDLGAWRLIGLDAQLLGSGLPEEAAQDAWLDAELGTATRPVALVLHKPLFLDHPGETAVGATTINPGPRARLLKRIAAADVRLVVSGHLHARRDVERDGVRYLWLPSTSFVHAGSPAGATPMIGATEIDLSSAEPKVRPMEVAGLVAHDLGAIKEHGRWRFLREMPPCPPPPL